jgi:hypothetical protein
MNNKEFKNNIRYLINAHNNVSPLVNSGCMIIPLPFSYDLVVEVFSEFVKDLGFHLNTIRLNHEFSECSSSIMINYEVVGQMEENE